MVSITAAKFECCPPTFKKLSLWVSQQILQNEQNGNPKLHAVSIHYLAIRVCALIRRQTSCPRNAACGNIDRKRKPNIKSCLQSHADADLSFYSGGLVLYNKKGCSGVQIPGDGDVLIQFGPSLDSVGSNQNELAADRVAGGIDLHCISNMHGDRNVVGRNIPTYWC